MFSRIAGTGSYLPEKILTNAELALLVDTSDEWIRSRTGIERRHVVVPGETTTDLAEHAARRAMEDAGVAPDDIDLIGVGAETLTRITDWSDRGTCVLFGDGAGAVVLKPSAEPGIISTRLHSEGRYKDLLIYPDGV